MTYLAASISEYLIQANIVLTICILIVLAFRFIMRKYSKAFSCYSWGIVAFGLLYFTIRPLHSPVNAIYTFFADRQWRDFGQAGTGDQEAGSMSFIENSGSDDYGYLENPGIFYESGQFLRNLSRTADERSGVSFLEIFFIVWFAGTLLLLIRYFYQYFKVTRRTRFAVRLQDNIFELDGCKTPFVHGIFRTRIYIPYGLSEAERSFIVTHEQCHIRHRDHLILLTAKLLVILFWMNPAGWIAYRKIRLDIEMRCDEYATEKLNAAEKREYSLLLLNMALSEKSARTVGFSSQGAVLKRRIKNIVQVQKRKVILPVCIMTACVLFLSVSIGEAAVQGNILSYRQMAGSSAPVVYENRELGFAIEFPGRWENSYFVEPNPQSPSGVVVCTEWGGILCFLSKRDAKEWEESVKNDLIVGAYRVLGESGDSVYVMYFASDVNYQGEEQTKIYWEMTEDLYHVGFEIL